MARLPLVFRHANYIYNVPARVRPRPHSHPRTRASRVYPAPHTHIITASSAAIVAPEDVVFRITGFTIWRSVPSQRDGYHTDVLSFVGFSCRFESRQ